MELYIGGFGQGKATYVKEKYQGKSVRLLEVGTYDDPDKIDFPESIFVLKGFHLMVKKRMVGPGKRNPEETSPDPEGTPEWFAGWLEGLLDLEKRGKTVLIICDEVGNGVVPIDGTERAYRECVGRCLIHLAKQADSVERVICGMGQKIK